MSIWDAILGRAPTQLKLQSDSTVRHIVPKVPVLDTSIASLTTYATKSELVYACIDKKAQAATDPELIVQRKTSDGEWEEVDGHPALEVLLEPNAWDDGESFLRTWIASENIAGEFYAEMVFSKAGIPVALYPLRPDWLRAQYRHTAKGEILDYYSYYINGYEIKFKPEELLIRRRHGLGSMFSGVSPLSVALGAVDADIASTEYIRAFFNNGGSPSGIINVTGRNLSDEEAERYQQKWMARYSRGGKMRGGPAVLSGDVVTYEPIGAGLDSLNSEELTSIDETRVCMAFGVPPVIIGSYVGLKNVNQKASFKGAMEEFWMNTMSPELKAIRKFLTRKFLPYFEDPAKIQREEIRFFWNMNNVEALQDDVDAIHDRIALGYKAGLYTLNEGREKLGLDAVEDEIGDEFYKAPAPMVGQPEEEPPPKPKQLVGGWKNLGEATEALAIMLDNKSCTCEKEGLFPATCETCKRRQIHTNGNGQKKTFESDGVAYSREPSELERLIDLKKAVDDQETESAKLAVVLMSLRSDLIDQAAREAVRYPVKSVLVDLAELVLAPPAPVWKLIRKVLEASFTNGQLQVLDELRRQDVANLEAAVKILAGDKRLETLTEATVARVVNEIQTRTINQVSSFHVLEQTFDVEDVIKSLEEQSSAWVDGYANNAVNAATQSGREAEMTNQSEGIKGYRYSAILDMSVCWFCKQWDGEQSEFLEGLPSVPNPQCSGKDRCRCRIIPVVLGG